MTYDTPHPFLFSFFLFFFSSGTKNSLITVHAQLQMRLGSDRLENRLSIITCSGLVCDQSVALHYPDGSVNKVLMQ